MDINFELYKIFYHAAKSGNFSEAAARLFISQSAVSQAVKGLEKRMGTQLFFRKTRSVKLTAEGEMLFRHIEQAYNFIKTAEEKILEMQSLYSGEIRVGVSDTICKYFLIPILERFNIQYPHIKIRVINRISKQITSILKNGLIDIGIVTLPVDDKTVSITDFMEVRDIFVASDRFPHLKDSPVPISLLAEQPLLMLHKESISRQNIDRIFREHNIEIVPEFELESMDLLVEFAKIGFGVAHVLKESAASAISSLELFQVNTRESLPSRKLGILTVRDVPLSHAASEFIRFLKPM